MLQSVEVIVTFACILGFGVLILIGFICLKKRFRLKWENCCDAVFTCGGRYPSEKTEDLRKQEQRAGRHRNSASVLSQPAYFGGRKRPEEIQPLSSAVEGQSVTQQDGDIDIESGMNDDVPIVQTYHDPPSGRQSVASSQQPPYYVTSGSRVYSSRADPSRMDYDRDALVADDDDEATI